MENTLTPENMQLNEVEPRGFTSEPRILSHEVWQLNHQVAALCDAIARLCDLQKEVAKKIDALNNPIKEGA
jgi:hypothetical protein